MNYYPFHIGDYLSATRHLSWEEDAAYRRLLDVYYTTEKALPADLRQVCRLVLATTEGQREAVATVLAEFFEQTESGWVNRRADAEIVEMQRKQQAARDKANARWDKQRQERGKADAMQQHDSGDAAASKSGADAMLPTPTPTPTPKIDKTAAGAARTKKPRIALPEDFAPNEAGMKAGMAAGLDMDRELEQFRNHHVAKGSAMADWQAAWRTWVGSAVQFGRGGKAARVVPRPEWAKAAGFDSVWEAENAGCKAGNAHLFRDGKRIMGELV